MKNRCEWAGNDPDYIAYHDNEWGVPLHDDTRLFELLVLEGAQAGLSWITILKKRSAYRLAFDGFAPEKVARYDDPKINMLMANSGIVRNRRKIVSAVQNARALLDVRREFGSFDAYVWSFVDGKQITNRWKSVRDIPAKTKISVAMSKDMKKRGFTFTGPVICYSFMQAAGLVNDHVTGCFRHREISEMAGRKK
ncbi:MAG: DNA-3-methyladenine glycosylase [Desulfococcus sp. 4484_241]|nr:MAG: DNA-3-methyladenine glycosylase [Desulfococcus sp. 4484_241]